MAAGTEYIIAADMEPLIRRVRMFQEDRAAACATMSAIPFGELSEKYGYAGKGLGKTEVILSEDTAVELGHPEVASVSAALITFQKEIVRDGAITVTGPDICEIRQGDRRSYAQIVILAVDADRAPDPFGIDNTQYMTNRLPGYMARSVPGRLWVRISMKAWAEGMNFRVVGSALIAAYKRDFGGVLAAEALFVTSSREDVEALGQVKTEADILSGRHKKLVLGKYGDVECGELNCEACGEKQVCDSLRDIVIKRRSIKK